MDFPEDVLKIDTPENVAVGLPIAGIGSRFIAALVDTLLIILLQAVVLLLGGLLTSMVVDSPIVWLDREDSAAWLLGILGMVGFVFLWGYYIFFELVWNGQSPGKRLAKLRVIRSNGTPLTLSESVIRNLLRLVDFLPAMYGLGVVAMFIDPQSRRLGDLAAGTLVVREPDAGFRQPDVPPPFLRTTEPPHLEGTGLLPVEKLLPADLEMLSAYFTRRNEFSNPNAVGKQVLNRLFERMELPPPELDHVQTGLLLSRIRTAVEALNVT